MAGKAGTPSSSRAMPRGAATGRASRRKMRT